MAFQWLTLRHRAPDRCPPRPADPPRQHPREPSFVAPSVRARRTAARAAAWLKAARESPPTPPEPTRAGLALTGQGGQSAASYPGSAADWPPPFCVRHAQPKTGLLLRRPVAGFYSAVDKRVSRGALGRVPRSARTRVSVPCWPARAFAGKTVPRTVFWPGSLLKPYLQGLAAGMIGERLVYPGRDVFLKVSCASGSDRGW